MTIPLDEMALEAALVAWFAKTAGGWETAMAAAISAYLASLPADTSGLAVAELVERLKRGVRPIGDGYHNESHWNIGAADNLMTEAAASLVRLAAERDELTRRLHHAIGAKLTAEEALDEATTASEAKVAERDEALRTAYELGDERTTAIKRAAKAEAEVAELREALAAEREECAKVAVNYPFSDIAALHSNQAVVTNASQNIAAAIRARAALTRTEGDADGE